MITKLKEQTRWWCGLILPLLACLILVPAPALAQPPSLPAQFQFYGYVYINGALAPAGTTVTAYVNDAQNSSTTVDSSGRYGYSPLFYVSGNAGNTVTFKVGNYWAPQTAVLDGPGATRLDLRITTTSLAVATSSATSVGPRTATLNGNLLDMGGSSLVNVFFQYGTSTAYGSTTAAQAKTTTGAFSAEVSGLNPNTLYHFRAVVQAGSVTVYGNDMTFTTTAPALSVVTNDATSVTASSAVLNGNLIDLGTNASVQVYFQYGTTPSVTSSTSPQTMIAPGTFSANLSGLLANTTYYFRAVAVGTTTVYGSIKSFTTGAGTLSVTTGMATELGPVSARLNGTLTALGSYSSANVYFQYGTSTAYGNSTTPQSRSSPGSFNAYIVGLSPNTTYHFRAVAQAGSTVVYGSDVQFITPVSACNPSDHRFYGYVYIGGVSAGASAVVEAYVDGVLKASTTTDSLGRYGYTTQFCVPGNSGATVTFKVNNAQAPQTATWNSGYATRLDLYVSGTPTLTITTTCPLPQATVGTAYSQTLQASGGTSPYTWSWTAISPSTQLPPGLSLSSGGQITGTPTTAGTYYFRLQVTDSASQQATKDCSLVVGTTPPPPGTKLIGMGDAVVSNGYSDNCFVLARFPAEQSGTMTKFMVRGYLLSGNIKVAIYSDNNGEPGSLLEAVNTGTPITANVWNEITFPNTSLTAGTYYWLAFISDNRVVSHTRSTTANVIYKTVSYDGFTFPSQAGTGFTSGGALPAPLIAGY